MAGNQAEFNYMQAAWKAVEHFPVAAEDIELVARSENVTFRVAVRDSDTYYVLRLHRPGYSSIEELESERQWTSALKEAGLAVQDAIATSAGEHYALVNIPGTLEQRYAGMTTWHEGLPLSDFLETCPDRRMRERILHRFGETAAGFHNQSTGWQAPSGFIRRRLDLDGLLGKDPLWGRFWEHPALTAGERELLLTARARLRVSLDTYGETPDRFSLIHADLTLDNIIYDGNDIAVIDFDDSAHGWHLYDIASALIECWFESDFEALRAAFLDGYHERRHLRTEDLDMLPDFLLVRGMSIIGWYLQRPEYAGAAEFDKFRTWVIAACQRTEP